MHSKGDVYAKRYMELDLAGYKKDRDSLSRYDFDPKTLFNRWWNYMYPTILTEGKTADEFVEKVQEMWDYMSEKGYSVSGGELLDSFEESKEQNNYSTSRATFVAWALISMDTKFYNYCSKRSREVIELDSYKMVDDGNGGQKPQLDSEGKPVHDTRYRSIHRLDDVANISVNRLCGRIITDFNELRKGDLIAFIDNGADDVTGLDILGDKKNGTFVRYTAEKDINKGDKPPQDFDENEFYNTSKYKSCFGIRIFEGSEYNGYEGNEMVASPVTGILLEYGTYDETNIDSITQEQYRVNTDLKYPFALKTVEDTIEGEETQSKIVSDKVGYAKILILDKENYSYIEQSTSNKWNISEGGTSLLAENGTYREELVDDDESTALDKTRGTDRWDDMDQTIYSYKEWAELYEQAGIAGNILYIDGFVCEEPDDDVEDVTTTLPKGEKITLDTYKKISESTLAGKSITEAQEMQLKSGWRDYNLYVTQSEKTNHKFEAEVRAKMRAYNSLYIDKVTDKQGQQPEGIDSLIVIKEGTILGRTMTDKELLESENFRNGSMGTYEQNREFQDWQKVDGKDRIIGNYLRMIMRDKDDTPVEDVERFFKDSIEEKLDWFELWFYTPMSSMATDEHLWGPEAIGSMYPGQLSVGLVQETDKQYPYWNSDGGSAIEKFLYKCWLLDDDLCARLEDFFGYKSDDFWAFAEGGKVFGRHHGLFYYLQEGTLYYPIAGYQSGTPCIYSDGSATPFSRTSRVRWGGVIYETFNDFIAAMGSSIAYAAGDDHAENQTIQILDENDNVIGSGL